jgi:hypothetical protein
MINGSITLFRSKHSTGDRLDVRSRLSRLIGKNAALSGKLVEWHTGYQRAAVVLDVQTVESTDADGMAALSAADPPKAKAREVMAYDITVRAGRSLTKEAREVGPNDLLSPVDDYAPHWVTGGDVVWLNCRDGYEVQSSSLTPHDGGLCAMANECGFGIPQQTTIKVYAMYEEPTGSVKSLKAAVANHAATIPAPAGAPAVRVRNAVA